jgi:hypothetical protein
MATDTGRGSRKGVVKKRPRRQTKMMDRSAGPSVARQAASACRRRSLPAIADLKRKRNLTLPRKPGRSLASAVPPRPSAASRADIHGTDRRGQPRRCPPEAFQRQRCTFRRHTDTTGFPYSRALIIVQTCFGPLSILHCTSEPRAPLFLPVCLFSKARYPASLPDWPSWRCVCAELKFEGPGAKYPLEDGFSIRSAALCRHE